MRKILLAIICIFCLSKAGAQNFNYEEDYKKILQRSKNINDSLYYGKLLKRFNANDTTLSNFEVLALMIGYTGQKNFKPYSYLDIEEEIYMLNDKAKFKDAIKVSDTFIISHPVSQIALIEKSYAFHKLGIKDSANKYSFRFRKIMEAMAWSGNGKTPETAIFAVGPTDGQNFIKKYYGADIGAMGSTRDKYENFCDMLEMKYEKNGETKSVKLYFAIEHATNTMFDDAVIDKILNEKK